MSLSNIAFIKRLKNTFLENFKAQGTAHFSEVVPNPLKNPILVSTNTLLAEELGLKHTNITEPAMLNIMAGDFSETSLKPIALVYSGHQFGVWAGQLGDHNCGISN